MCQRGWLSTDNALLLLLVLALLLLGHGAVVLRGTSARLCKVTAT
jgi:hypothetical protein